MNHCPPLEQLQLLLAGTMDAAESDVLDLHLEGCCDCQRLLGELSDGEQLPRWRQWLQEDLRPAADYIHLADTLAELQPATETPVTWPAGYQVLSVLGRGGAGVVFKARHLSLGRFVALKVLRAGTLASAQERTRFIQEAEAAARMSHPHLVQIYEVGQHHDLPYLALEYIEGGSLAERLTGDPLPATIAADLAEILARAIQHAHERDIVHRDLKPANVLLQAPGVSSSGSTGSDTTENAFQQEHRFGIPKITDFGLAKRLDGASSLTDTGTFLGTPSYAAPEQAQGHKHVGPAADIYSLGAILYELLTGRPPFRAATPLETLLQVVHHDPVPPRQMLPEVPVDLETICLKCLHKDPQGRYASAAALADDLRRFREGRTILARPIGGVGKGLRWCRRNPAMAGLALAFVFTLLAGTTTATWLAVRAEHNASLAQANEQEAIREKAKADQAREVVQRNLYQAEMILAGQAADQAGGLRRVHELLVHWLPTAGQTDRRGWEWYYLHGLGRRALRTFSGHSDAVVGLAFCADGKRLASVARADGLRVWDAYQPRALIFHSGGETRPRDVAWSPDGRTLALACADRTLRLVDSDTGQLLAVMTGHQSEVARVAWSPDGRRLATGDGGGWIRLWDATTHQLLRSQQIPGRAWAQALDWSPDGKTVAFSDGGQVHLLEVATGKTVLLVNAHQLVILDLRWSPDSRLLASASEDQTVRVWDPRTGKEACQVLGHPDKVWTVCWHPDGSRLATGGADHTIRVWNSRTGQLLDSLRGHTSAVRAVCWSPDGRLLASASEDASVRLWDIQVAPQALPALLHGGEVRALAWSPDGQRLASGGTEPVVRLWDPDTGQQVMSLQGHTADILSLAWAGDGRLASGSSSPQKQRWAGDHTIKIWDPRLGQELLPLPVARPGFLDHRVTAVAWSHDGRHLATVNEGWHLGIRVWDTSSGKEITTLRGHKAWNIYSLTWAPNRLLVSASDDHLKVWDVEGGLEVASLTGHAGPVLAVAWSPDGSTLASGGSDGTVLLWDGQTWEQKGVLSGHTGPVNALSWHPDGNRLASGSDDHLVKIWDTLACKETLTVRGHDRRVRTLGWSPDGFRLASGSQDGTLRIHDATAGYAAEASAQLLPGLQRRFQVRQTGPAPAAALRLRARIRAQQGQWDSAAADWLAAAQHEKAPPKLFVASWCLAESPSDGAPVPTLQPGEMDPTISTRDGGPWKGVSGGEDGWLLLSNYLPPQKPVRVLARLRVYAPDQRAVALSTRLIQDVKIWLNGQPVVAGTQTHLTLHSGWNTIVFQVRIMEGAHYPTLFISEALADRLQALAGQARWEEAANLARVVLEQQEDGPLLLLASRALRNWSEQLRRQGQLHLAQSEYRQARLCCERLLARHPEHAGYTLELVEVMLPPLERDWVILEPTQLKAEKAKLTCLEDHSILASGPNGDSETYTVTAPVPLEGITAVRLEALPHSSLPLGGTGRYPANGNFNLTEFSMSTRDAGDARGKMVALSEAWADFAQARHLASQAIDGNLTTWWDTWPRQRESHRALFALRTPLREVMGSLLVVRLDFSGQVWKNHALGRFRLAVSNQPNPLRLSRWRDLVTGPGVHPWTRLGIAHGLVGEWQSAQQYLKRAVTLPSAYSLQEHAWLALSCAHLGQANDALRWQTALHKLMEKTPPDDAVTELLTELKAIRTTGRGSDRN
ncbi:MAG: protein kinase [Gemmataceae bacterium]